MHIVAQLQDLSEAVASTASQDVTLSACDNALTLNEQALATGTIAGAVTDSAGPVSGAHVVLTETIGNRPFTYQTFADGQGHYSLDVLAGKARLVTFERPGDERSSQAVTVPNGATTTVDVTLARAPSTV